MSEYPKEQVYRVPNGTRLVVKTYEGTQQPTYRIVQEVDGRVLHETAEVCILSPPHDVVAIGLQFAAYLGLKVDIPTRM